MQLITLFKPFHPTDTDTYWVPVIYDQITGYSGTLYKERYGLYGGVVTKIAFDDEHAALCSANNLCYRTRQAARCAVDKMIKSVNENNLSFKPGTFEDFWFPNPITCTVRKKTTDYGHKDDTAHHHKFRDFFSSRSMCYRTKEDAEVALRIMLESLIWK